MAAPQVRAECLAWYIYTKSDTQRNTKYEVRTKYEDELKHRVTAVITTIPVDMLQIIWQEDEYRLDVVSAAKAVHVEVF